MTPGLDISPTSFYTHPPLSTSLPIRMFNVTMLLFRNPPKDHPKQPTSTPKQKMLSQVSKVLGLTALYRNFFDEGRDFTPNTRRDSTQSGPIPTITTVGCGSRPENQHIRSSSLHLMLLIKMSSTFSLRRQKWSPNNPGATGVAIFTERPLF